MIARITDKLLRRKRCDMEYVPEGWARQYGPDIKGWNVNSVVRAQLARLGELRDALAGTRPPAEDVVNHNNFMTFAYVAALAARAKEEISILDWGGGVGQYGLIAQGMLAGVTVRYYCKEVPVQCEAGRRINPGAVFYLDDDQYDGKQFDLVLASGSLQYVEDWQFVLKRLARATRGYLFITRLPVSFEGGPYVWVQRAHSVGYGTEYLAWCLNRRQFLETVVELGGELVREFFVAEQHRIRGAPADCHTRGFLFRVG